MALYVRIILTSANDIFYRNKKDLHRKMICGKIILRIRIEKSEKEKYNVHIGIFYVEQ